MCTFASSEMTSGWYTLGARLYGATPEQSSGCFFYLLYLRINIDTKSLFISVFDTFITFPRQGFVNIFGNEIKPNDKISIYNVPMNLCKDVILFVDITLLTII